MRYSSFSLEKHIGLLAVDMPVVKWHLIHLEKDRVMQERLLNLMNRKPLTRPDSDHLPILRTYISAASENNTNSAISSLNLAI